MIKTDGVISIERPNCSYNGHKNINEVAYLTYSYKKKQQGG